MAATAGLLWYGSLFVVSMLGAPSFAVGNGRRHPPTRPTHVGRARSREHRDAERRPMMKGGRRLRDGTSIYWWVEILAILAFYVVYSAIRNANGSAPAARVPRTRSTSSRSSTTSASSTRRRSRAGRCTSSRSSSPRNYFYGSLHFIVTIGVGVWSVPASYSDDYPRFRNTLAITTALALIGFTLFPLMPPRLLDTLAASRALGFVDTLASTRRSGRSTPGPASKISNQYAAMPSVHIAWATWCALALVPRLKTTCAQVLAGGYPVVTLVVIVITANHYVLDAVGGLVILAIGWLLGEPVHTRRPAGPARELGTAAFEP